jgi:HPt (histidine-containing phosphotransfer) domain-containing protein
MEDIQSAAASGDLKRTAAAAHTLKGSSANIGALSLHEKAGLVEAAAKRGEPADAQALQSLQEEFERTRVALEKERTPPS